MNRLAALLISFLSCQLVLANLVTEQSFDALGHKTNQTDAAGTVTRFEYDALGHLTAVIDAQNHRTAYSYDEAGNKIAQTDANGHTTRWTYDAMGRVTTHTLPMNQTERFTYDAGGNVQTHTDFNGQTTAFTYDINNRVTDKTYADGSGESFTYTPTGQVATVNQSRGTACCAPTLYTYDAMDRLVSETKPGGEQLSYSYDANGNRTSVTTTVGNTSTQTAYTYDELNRLASATDANGTTQYSYDAVGNRSSVVYPNAFAQRYSYDALNRLTELTTEHQDAITERYSYTLDATGKRTAMSELNGRSTHWTYDNLNRLTAESISAGNTSYSASYVYDNTGNRISQTVDGVATAYSYDANDQLQNAGGISYTYDANGSTLTETDSVNNTQKSYTYNAKNELIAANDGNANTTFSYDQNGIRNKKTENGITTQYVTDSNRDYAQVLAEIQNSTTTATYTYGDDLISQQAANDTSYYLYDGLGSTRALSNTQGSITDTYEYAAFGEKLAATGTTTNAYRYTGEQFDEGLNQYYLRARYYNQEVGRFAQRDTYEGSGSDPVTLHKYLYANVNPVSVIDPSGYIGMTELAVTMNLVSLMTTLQVNNALDVLEGQHVDVNDARFVNNVVAIASMGSTGIALTRIVARKLISKFPKLSMQVGNSSAFVFVSPEATAKFIARKGYTTEAELRRLVPDNTPNSWRNSPAYEWGNKYEFQVGDSKVEIWWHSRRIGGDPKYVDASGSTARIVLDGEFLGVDGKWYKNGFSAITHIPLLE